MYPDGLGGMLGTGVVQAPATIGASGFNNGLTTPVALSGATGATNLLLALAGRRQALPVQPDDGGWTLLGAGQALHPGNIEENGVAIWGKVYATPQNSIAWANGGVNPYVTKAIVELTGRDGATLLAGITPYAVSDQAASNARLIAALGTLAAGRLAFGIWVSGVDNDTDSITALGWTTDAFGNRDQWNQTGANIFGGFPSVNVAHIAGAGAAVNARTDDTAATPRPWGGVAIVLPP